MASDALNEIILIALESFNEWIADLIPFWLEVAWLVFFVGFLFLIVWASKDRLQ